MQILVVLGYLDPGTGSVVIQAVVGSLLGALLVIKLYWRKILAFLTGRKSARRGGQTPDAKPHQSDQSS
jgi:hypothetical protein